MLFYSFIPQEKLRNLRLIIGLNMMLRVSKKGKSRKKGKTKN